MTVGRLNLPYTGIPSFMRSHIQTDLTSLDADFAIIGVPTDEGGPWIPGTRFGPRGIREQSVRFGSSSSSNARGGYFDIDSGKRFLEEELDNQRIVDCGDIDITYTNRAQTFEDATRAIRQILSSGAIPVVLGGDHGITYPVVRAYSEPIIVIQFDAHMDYGAQTDKVQLSNGMPMRLIAQLPNVARLVQVGIRGLRTRQSDVDDSRDDGNTVLSMRDYRELGLNALLNSVPAGSRTYITIDIDAFDLPLVPGCASGELDGFAYQEMREALFALVQHTRVVGFDLVEVNPMLDVPSGATSFLGAQLITELIAHIASR